MHFHSRIMVSPKMLTLSLLILSFSTLAALAQNSGLAEDKKVVCYFSSWAIYRNGNGRFEAGNIDPFLCTHVIYSFIGTNSDGTVRIMDSWSDVILNGFKKLNDLKLRNGNLKTLVALGGWNDGSTGFSEICRDPTLRAKFVDNVYDFLTEHKFNGLDLDWEYPAQREGIAEDKANFVTLVKELQAKFTPKNLLLSAAVNAALWAADVSYDIPQLAANLDFINLMTYEYHGARDGRTGQNSPLYAASIDADKNLNVQSTVEFWSKHGGDKSKLVLGVPFYGRSFSLSQPNNAALGAPTAGHGTEGPFSQETGFLMYSEICSLQKTQNGWTESWNSEQQVPFTFRNYEWVGYENIESVNIKGQYAKNSSLGGVMAYALEMDDFHNLCGDGRNPLLNALSKAFLG